ncbi:pyridoxamine 5'-phosphate oxidase family protein [Maribacter sp. CXY002]|uniref:pyridoxamine 5'-phosphate oxidase family protein n=1 Tax=Maribacter luteocoastalis TaxID=3407671 RepID=UPI003B66C6DC
MTDLTKKDCLQLLENNYIGRLAFISAGHPEILPITYYYDKKKNSIITYSGDGGKIKAMRQNGSVSFQVDEIISLDKWKSVLLYGDYEEMSGIDAKHLLHEFSEGVKKIIQKKEYLSPQFISEFSSKLNTDTTPIVYRINISEIKGKQRK